MPKLIVNFYKSAFAERQFSGVSLFVINGQ
jgi:hypothetical protein